MRLFLFFSTFFIYTVSYSQVAIGHIKPHVHSQLDVSAVSAIAKGVLIPRVTLRALDNAFPFDISSITLPESLLVYNTGSDPSVVAGYYYWRNNQWNKLIIASDGITGPTGPKGDKGDAGPEVLSVSNSVDTATGSGYPLTTTVNGVTGKAVYIPEPWNVVGGTTKATNNTENIYQMGAVAIGKNNVISGTSLDVKGAIRGGNPNTSETVGTYSIAIGNGVVANGSNSIAFGYQTTAKANEAIAFGNNTTSNSYIETVFGRYNAITRVVSSSGWTLTDPLLQIGNGSSSIRNNALTILKNGNTGVGISGTEESSKPTERLDIGSGNVRIRDINKITGTAADKNVVADANGVLKIRENIDFFIFGDIKQGFQTGDHNGWIKLDGRATSRLTATQRTQANLLGFITSLPNATNKVLKQKTSLNTTGGNNTVTITQANIPNYTLPTARTSTNGAHTHNYEKGYSRKNFSPSDSWWKIEANRGFQIQATSSSGDHTHTVTVKSGGSGVPLNVEDEYLSVNTFVYLGN